MYVSCSSQGRGCRIRSSMDGNHDPRQQIESHDNFNKEIVIHGVTIVIWIAWFWSHMGRGSHVAWVVVSVSNVSCSPWFNSRSEVVVQIGTCYIHDLCILFWQKGIWMGCYLPSRSVHVIRVVVAMSYGRVYQWFQPLFCVFAFIFFFFTHAHTHTPTHSLPTPGEFHPPMDTRTLERELKLPSKSKDPFLAFILAVNEVMGQRQLLIWLWLLYGSWLPYTLGCDYQPRSILEGYHDPFSSG